MTLPIPVCLQDFSTTDLLDLAWEPEVFEAATPLERVLLLRLSEACASLEANRKERASLLAIAWNAAIPR